MPQSLNPDVVLQREFYQSAVKHLKQAFGKLNRTDSYSSIVLMHYISEICRMRERAQSSACEEEASRFGNAEQQKLAKQYVDILMIIVQVR